MNAIQENVLDALFGLKSRGDCFVERVGRYDVVDVNRARVTGLRLSRRTDSFNDLLVCF